MARPVRKCIKEFKQQAVHLALKSPSVESTAKELGIPTATLHSWVYALKKKGSIVIVNAEVEEVREGISYSENHLRD